MKSQQIVCQQLAWEPNPLTKLVKSQPVKEGKKLAASISEDVGAFSLSPTYSSRQLRTIRRRQIQSIKYGHGNTRHQKHGGRLQW